jgi:hypothetical protein
MVETSTSDADCLSDEAGNRFRVDKSIDDGLQKKVSVRLTHLFQQ